MTYVAIDFNRQSLGEALGSAGFDAGRCTFFIWEGVTNYLTEDAVNATLEFIGTTAPRSRVVFTYVHRDVLRNPGQFPGGRALARMMKLLEETWTFGLDPAAVPALVEAHGLRLIDDVGSVDYRAKYLGPNGRHLKGYEFYRVAIAEKPAGTPQL